jgi:energy-coupling factor transport system ATP-binding protein
MNYQEFLPTKLNQVDLDRYADLLNDLHHRDNQAAEAFFQAKKRYQAKQMDQADFVRAKANKKEAHTRYLDALHTKIFAKNYHNIARIHRRTKVYDTQYEAINEDYLYAKNLLIQAKEIVRTKGRIRELSKLNQTAIKIRNLSFTYTDDKHQVLNDINLSIPAGDYVAVVGHNGSGKSTLSKLLIGVLHAKKGEIEVFGNLLTEDSVERVRQFLGIVFQNPDNQFIGATVQDDIAFGLENKRVDPTKMQAIIVDVAKKVNMVPYLEKEPLMLSGGQKQRVAIASTLALDPDIIIFDEATSMLDPKGKNEVKAIMKGLASEKTKTIISITHDMDEILNADQVVVMNHGQVVRVGSPQTIMEDKAFLREIGLELPFVGTVEEALGDEGIFVGSSTSIEELAVKLCQTV